MGLTVLSGAQTTTVTKPNIEVYTNGYIISGITPNGKYTLYENRNEDEKSGGKIVNLLTGESTVITAANTDASDMGQANDISNDANIAVGVYEEFPAYWNKTTGLWTNLETSTDVISGEAVGVSADGKYAVGREFYGEYAFGEMLWDLTTGKKVALNNVPTLDLNSENNNQNQFLNISADGRYILGCLSYSYPDQQNYYVYDRETETTDYIGFTYRNTRFIAQEETLHHIDAATMSPNGLYVTGRAYTTDNNTYAFVYNCTTKEFTIYNTDLDSGIVGIGVDDSGNVYGATPADDPQRYLYIRSGKYWYSMDNILTQRYGINFADKTGLDYTGTPVAVSGDGRFIGTFANPEDGEGCNYTFYESVQDACSSVDLMGIYTVSPVSGSSFSTVSSLTISFDRDIQLLGETSSARLLKSDGTTVRNSMGLSVEGSKATITFRPTTMTAGEEYTVLIPAGTFAMASDTDVKSKDITISYVGRSNTPVTAGTIYPTPGSAVSKLDYSSSHVLAYFDTYIQAVDGAKAKVYRNAETDAYEEMSLYTSGNVLAVYPTSTLYFFKGNTYKVVVPAGSITDAGGSGKNEELVIEYTGNYEREVSSTDKVLFSEDFSDGLGTQFMFYDGDGNTPTEEMQGYGFTATSTPWWVASDDATVDPSGNYAAMSTSAYSPAGASDDWMVTPSLYLPDENCYLTFKTQGFRKMKLDKLSVYIIPTSKVFTTLSEEAMTELRANKISLYNAIVSPGSSEENLIDEWTNVNISLSDYAGQDVYIAFVNENRNKSIVFVDDVEVIHDMNYLVAIDNETTVVGKDNIQIFGRIAVQNEASSYSTAHLELQDSEGTVIDTIDATGLTIDTNNSYSFSFNNPLPLAKGKEVDFKLVVKLDNDSYTITRTITNLAFSPTKRVFLEEYAGAECKNCPIGILAMEKLEEELPDNFIGITIRTYDNDELSSGLSGYSSYLGFTAAPTAMINRKVIASPMDKVDGSYVFSNPNNMLWSDIVYSELDTPAIADISITASMDKDETKIDVPVTVKYALDKKDVNVSLFFVVVEDQIQTYQTNTFYTISDPNLGEWGKGGIYAKSTVRKYKINDIARAAIGTTYNGTQGYVPTSVEAGVANTSTVQFNVPSAVSDMSNARVVAVMIDNNTDYVINAAQCNITVTGNNNDSGVNDVVTNGNISIDAEDGNVVVCADSQATVTVYNVSGSVIATAQGEGTVVANTNGYTGVAIVRVVTNNDTLVKKVIVK
jgi:hypothetical protein